MIQNLPIRSKLVAVLILPVFALSSLAAVRIGTDISDGIQADRIGNVTGFAVGLSGLVHELQKERDLAAGYVGTDKREGYGTMIAQRVWVNQALTRFRADLRELDPGSRGGRIEDRLVSAERHLNGLGEERRAIDEPVPVRLEEPLAYYTNAINELIAVTAEIPAESDDRGLIADLSTFVALSRAKEATAFERTLLHTALAAGGFAPGQFQRYATVVGAEETWLAQFASVASEAQRQGLAQTVAGPDVDRVKAVRDQVLASERGSLSGIDEREWFFAMNAKVDLLRQVELRLTSDVLASSAAATSSAVRQAILEGAGLAVVLALSIGLSILMARAMVRSLRLLKDAAEDVADRRLPLAVERLQSAYLDHQDGGGAGDADATTMEMKPISVRSRDEIGQVADAFNTVHRVAVQVATEQAALRRSVGDMFLNLARRNQLLIDRQLELIDELEQGELDPDALEELFRLDHLATRMRRNAEDLIVLSGAKPARRWSQPVSLADAIRAALAEVEEYTRVELLPMPDLGITGQAVGDVVHLLAELIENATAFSPPGTRVHIAGQADPDGYIIEIEDRGIGMADAELADVNERLADPPTVDLTLSQRLGLFVVGRLAKRHGIKVQLRHSWYDGVTALVLVPDSLLVRREQAPDQLDELDQLDASDHHQLALPAPDPPGDDEPAPDGDGVDRLPIFEAARSQFFVGDPDEGGGGPRSSPRGDPRTGSGLPRRVPRASLGTGPGPRSESMLPGGPQGTFAAERSPNGVRNRLASYRRGFERGRQEAGGGRIAADRDASPPRSDLEA
jgi:signal transduction histidine kinase